MCFHCYCHIEDIRGKGQLRNRSLPNLNTAGIDPLLVYSAGKGDALFGKIDTINFSLRCEGGQLTNRSASTTTCVEDGVALVYRNVRQTPIRYLGVPRIHVPQDESAQQSCRLLALIPSRSSAGHGWSPLDYLRCVNELVTGKNFDGSWAFRAMVGNAKPAAMDERSSRERQLADHSMAAEPDTTAGHPGAR